MGSLVADARAAKLLYSPDTTVHVCVGADAVLHVTETNANCPANQKSLFLQKAGTDVDYDQDGGKSAQAANGLDEADRTRLAQLEQRVKELEAMANRGELGNRVTAPFKVFDRAGKLIFEVDDHMASLFNESGAAVAWIDSSPDVGARFGTKSTSGGLDASLAASPLFAGVRVEEGGKERIDLGRNTSAGTYRLQIYGASGRPVAAIGQDPDRKTGTVLIEDAAGNTRAALGLDEQNRGRIAVSSGQGGLIIAALTEGEFGGGLLRLLNADGKTSMVEAGTNSSGVGVVSAGPNGFKPGMGVLGLPASFIAGKN